MTGGDLRDFDAFQRQVGEWSGKTFPLSTRYSIAAHLDEEVAELTDTLHEGRGVYEYEEEAANCLLLLLHLAHTLDFSLAEATRRKFGRNQRRRLLSTRRGG